MSFLMALRRLPLLRSYFGARLAYKRDEIPRALEYHSRVMRLKPRPRDKAFHATLLILDRRSQEARLLFEDAIRELEAIQNADADQEYLLNYCRYYIDVMLGGDGDEFHAVTQRVGASDIMRRSFPLPVPNLTT